MLGLYCTPGIALPCINVVFSGTTAVLLALGIEFFVAHRLITLAAPHQRIQCNVSLMSLPLEYLFMIAQCHSHPAYTRHVLHSKLGRCCRFHAHHPCIHAFFAIASALLSQLDYPCS